MTNLVENDTKRPGDEGDRDGVDVASRYEKVVEMPEVNGGPAERGVATHGGKRRASAAVGGRARGGRAQELGGPESLPPRYLCHKSRPGTHGPGNLLSLIRAPQNHSGRPRRPQTVGLQPMGLVEARTRVEAPAGTLTGEGGECSAPQTSAILLARRPPGLFHQRKSALSRTGACPPPSRSSKRRARPRRAGTKLPHAKRSRTAGDSVATSGVPGRAADAAR